MPRPFGERKPWPLKWIVLAIVLFIGGYTFLTLQFRKPDRPYEPYRDMKERATTGRLLAAGYQRIEVAAQRPADAPLGANTALPAPGGLPEELRTTLLSQPHIPAEIVHVHAAAAASALKPYPIQFRCILPDDRQQLATVEVYVKDDEMVVVPLLEPLTGGLQARTRENAATVVLPPDSLKPGSYRARVIGERASRAWLLQLN